MWIKHLEEKKTEGNRNLEMELWYDNRQDFGKETQKQDYAKIIVKVIMTLMIKTNVRDSFAIVTFA